MPNECRINGEWMYKEFRTWECMECIECMLSCGDSSSITLLEYILSWNIFLSWYTFLSSGPLSSLFFVLSCSLISLTALSSFFSFILLFKINKDSKKIKNRNKLKIKNEVDKFEKMNYRFENLPILKPYFDLSFS